MNTKKWLNQGKFTQIHSHQIFYHYNNLTKETPIVLLHGFPTASWDWWKVWKLMKDDFSIITFDFLGFGFSDKPPSFDYTIHYQTDITLELLSKLHVEKYHVLAHDYGNSVAQELMARQQEGNNHGLQSVCFLNGGLFPEAHNPRLIQKLMLSPLGKYLHPFIGKSSLRRNFKQIFGPDTQPTEEEIDQFWELVTNNGGKKIMYRLIRYINDRREHRKRWRKPIAAPTIPIRLIDGLKDPISGISIFNRFKEISPAPDAIALPEIGHYPNTEAPEQVVRHYLDFIQATT